MLLDEVFSGALVSNRGSPLACGFLQETTPLMAQKRALLEAVAYNTPGVPHPPFAFTPAPQGSLPSALRLERQALKGPRSTPLPAGWPAQGPPIRPCPGKALRWERGNDATRAILVNGNPGYPPKLFSIPFFPLRSKLPRSTGPGLHGKGNEGSKGEIAVEAAPPDPRFVKALHPA